MLPVEPAAAWFKLGWPERQLGAVMFTVFGNDEMLDVPIEDVADVVCKRCNVDSRYRQKVRASIERIVAANLIVADGPVTRLLYSRHAHRAWNRERSVTGQRAVGEPTATQPRTDSEPTVTRPRTVSETEVSARNDSNHAPHKEREIEEKEKRERTRASARPLEVELEEGEPEPETSTLELVKAAWKARLIMATGNPPSQSHKLRPHYEAIAQWVDEKNGDPKRIVTRLMDGAFRDKWMQDNGYQLGALAGSPGKYFDAQKNGRNPRKGFMRSAAPEDFEGGLTSDDVFGAVGE